MTLPLLQFLEQRLQFLEQLDIIDCIVKYFSMEKMAFMIHKFSAALTYRFMNCFI